MTVRQRQVALSLFLIGVIYFFLFWRINLLGAKDLYMLSVFAPDEFAQYPYILQMLNLPAESWLQSIYRFIQYKHYYYGYPFYLYSALFALLPLRLIGISSTPADLLMLRQMVSVLPMLASAGLLVYMQTKFQSFIRSILLFLFLLTIPMAVVNNIWWHPESLVLFFIVLTLFFLQKDDLSFRRDFYFSAITCGLAIATKLIGLFFFLAVPAYIFLGWFRERITLKQSLQLSVKFILLMTVAFFVSSPFLAFKSERDAAIKSQTNQSEATSSGFVFSSEKGPALWMPVITEYYAQFAFLGLACLAVFAGIANRKNRLPNLLIFLWCVPFGLYLLFFVTLRHRYYFMPVLLPFFSTVPNIFDWLLARKTQNGKLALPGWLGILIAASIVGSQVIYNLGYDKAVYVDGLNKETNSEALAFHSFVDREYLSHITLDRQLSIYRSVRVYVADDLRWIVRSRWSLVNYSYIEKTNPDVIILWKQEVLDYTNLDVIDNAVQPSSFEDALPFYQDARNGSVKGYALLYENDFGMFFVSEALTEAYFK